MFQNRIWKFVTIGLLALISYSFFIVPFLPKKFQADPAPETRLPLRAVSFNIRYGTANDGDNAWENRKELVVRNIRELNPDLLGTQETLNFQKQYLAKNLPEYASLGVGRADGIEEGEMMAIFYRRDRFLKIDEGHFWLSETPKVPGSQSWDAACERMASWVVLKDLKQGNVPDILFINTHLDHVSELARKEGARLIREQLATLAPGTRVVLTGDFNTDADSEPHKVFLAESENNSTHLVDTYQVTPPLTAETQSPGTFSGFQQTARGKNRIDWVLCSPDFEVISSGIDRTHYEGRVPSDHFAVWAVLR